MSAPDSRPDNLEKQDVHEDEASLLSLEDLQKEIDKADPEFNNSLQELGAIKSSSLDASLD
ncbi:MAG TPA: hypothetical protein PLJ21_08565, partial [Pseudobdellovibrionaceae bacterium]|nr:hypothetical protein [Pseudobdellovibrionaceae bacterium]